MNGGTPTTPTDPPCFCEKCGASDFLWRDHRGCSVCFEGPFLGPEAQAQMDWLFGVRRV